MGGLWAAEQPMAPPNEDKQTQTNQPQAKQINQPNSILIFEIEVGGLVAQLHCPFNKEKLNFSLINGLLVICFVSNEANPTHSPFNFINH